MSVSSKALWFIESHLNSELTLETIADAAEVSRFHLSRAFASSTGVSLFAYVRGRQLSEAAKALAKGAPNIMSVALEAGYGSHEAFTRAFRQHFGLAPEQVRAQAHAQNITLQESIRMDQATATFLAKPRIVTGEVMLVFGLARRCSSMGNSEIPAQWNQFGPYIGHIEGQIGSVAYGVIYNSEDSGSHDYLCGVAVRAFPSHPAEFTRLRIPPQTYAVFEHKGHVAAIAGTWKAIWEMGLAGYQASDGSAFERYDERFDGRTGLGGFEIWVPVRA